MQSDRTLLKWYKLINKKFFDNKLPRNTCVRWSNEDDDEENFEEKYFGVADYCHDGVHTYQIVLSKNLCSTLVTKVSTVVHEMIHIATELKDDHGPAFDAILIILIEKGLFRKHSLLKGRTLF